MTEELELEKQKILIVDDMPLNIQVLNQVLEHDYQTFFATSGKDALDLALTVLPDLMLLDIKMPDMDGYELCRQIKNAPVLKHIPVIFITSLNQEEDETIGLELGAVDYISKPFSSAIVKLRVRNHLELKRQRDILSKLSSLDGLTGIANRRIFDEYYQWEWKRCTRTQTFLSLILLDIDYFKAFNDHYGHLHGDNCLKKVAQTLANAVKRSNDLVARYGGEEFVCLLPETNFEGLVSVAEHMRKRIESLQIPHANSCTAPYVTISIGGGTIKHFSENTPESFLGFVDRLLYQVKNQGRNNIKCAAI
ncbi:MAG: diguanylate cyclase [Desulfobacterales bacterium]|nr:diguanylate cyclase [Desulfobacterales bacterium]